jgi:hypothetical protein
MGFRKNPGQRGRDFLHGYENLFSVIAASVA